MTVYLHHVPGRLRIQTPQLRGNEQAARRACGDVMTIDGVTKARGDSMTGGLVVLYEHQRLTAAALWAALAERGLVSGAPPFADGAGVTRLANAHADADGTLLGAVAGIAVGKLIERCALALIGALI